MNLWVVRFKKSNIASIHHHHHQSYNPIFFLINPLPVYHNMYCCNRIISCPHSHSPSHIIV